MTVRIRGSFRETLRDAGRRVVRDVIREGQRRLDNAVEYIKRSTRTTSLVPKWKYGRVAEQQPTETVRQAWNSESFDKRPPSGADQLLMGSQSIALNIQLSRVQARVYNDSMAFQPGNEFTDRFNANRVITEAFKLSGALGLRALRFYGC